jgi:hypothetical protein
MRQYLNVAVAAAGGRNQLKKMYPQLKPSSVNRILNSLEDQMEGEIAYNMARITSELNMRASKENNKINKMLKELGTTLPSLLKRPTKVRKVPKKGLSSMSALLGALPKIQKKKKK